MRNSFAIIFGTQMSVHYAHIVLELEPDRYKDGYSAPKIGEIFAPRRLCRNISRTVRDTGLVSIEVR